MGECRKSPTLNAFLPWAQVAASGGRNYSCFMKKWKQEFHEATVVPFFLAAALQGSVEISYMGPGGPIASPMEDAVKEFERRSQAAHQADPHQPVYHVVSGQNASR